MPCALFSICVCKQKSGLACKGGVCTLVQQCTNYIYLQTVLLFTHCSFILLVNCNHILGRFFYFCYCTLFNYGFDPHSDTFNWSDWIRTACYSGVQWALTCWSSSHTMVTSKKSLPSHSSLNEELIFLSHKPIQQLRYCPNLVPNWLLIHKVCFMFFK